MQKADGSLRRRDIANTVFLTVGEIAKKPDFLAAGLRGQDVYGRSVEDRDGEARFRIDLRKGKDATRISELVYN